MHACKHACIEENRYSCHSYSISGLLIRSFAPFIRPSMQSCSVCSLFSWVSISFTKYYPMVMVLMMMMCALWLCYFFHLNCLENLSLEWLAFDIIQISFAPAVCRICIYLTFNLKHNWTENKTHTKYVMCWKTDIPCIFPQMGIPRIWCIWDTLGAVNFVSPCFTPFSILKL